MHYTAIGGGMRPPPTAHGMPNRAPKPAGGHLNGLSAVHTVYMRYTRYTQSAFEGVSIYLNGYTCYNDYNQYNKYNEYNEYNHSNESKRPSKLTEVNLYALGGLSRCCHTAVTLVSRRFFRFICTV